MTLNALVKEICKREGKKSQVAIGNVREILKCIAEIEAELLVKHQQDMAIEEGCHCFDGPIAALKSAAEVKAARVLKRKARR